MSRETKKSDSVPEKYFHIHVENNMRVHRATVYGRKVDDVWFASVAFCAHGDTFDRRIGRQMARRKFFAEYNKWTNNDAYVPRDLYELMTPDLKFEKAVQLVELAAPRW